MSLFCDSQGIWLNLYWGIPKIVLCFLGIPSHLKEKTNHKLCGRLKVPVSALKVVFYKTYILFMMTFP